jgi:hypothetical protein
VPTGPGEAWRQRTNHAERVIDDAMRQRDECATSVSPVTQAIALAKRIDYIFSRAEFPFSACRVALVACAVVRGAL